MQISDWWLIEMLVLHSVTYLNTFNSVKTNKEYWKELLISDSNSWNHLTMKIKLLALDSKTWNHLAVYMQIINTEQNY